MRLGIPLDAMRISSRFQSTHPVWDATGGRRVTLQGGKISIHASRMGCDYNKAMRMIDQILFQSTHPVWDATLQAVGDSPVDFISIHASRMGCDMLAPCRILGPTYFNPRIPYGMRPGCAPLMAIFTNFNPRIPYGMRPEGNYTRFPTNAFQSTHPVWDATAVDNKSGRSRRISIHASRMGCDLPSPARRPPRSVFQSTHPVWDATSFRLSPTGKIKISIHASRMGCDVQIFRLSSSLWLISIHASRMGCDHTIPIDTAHMTYFNPRIPYGMRPFQSVSAYQTMIFQSTHPVWDATQTLFPPVLLG